MDMFNYAMSDLLGRQRQEEAETRARARRNEAFRSDPSKADNLVASITANLSPSGTKPQMSKFASKLDAYESTIPEDHPFKGLSGQLKERLLNVINQPEGKNLNPGLVAEHLTKKMLMESGKSGAPRIQEAFEYKRRADAALFSSGDSVRKPLGGAYDAWLKGMQESEKPENIIADLRAAGKNKEADEYARDLSPIATPGGLALNVGVGALVGGLTAGPPGAALGAVGGAASEIFGRPIAKEIEQSEWYKSRWGPKTATRESASLGKILTGAGVGAVAGTAKGGLVGGVIGTALGAGAMTDTGQQLLTDIAPYAVGQAGFDKALAAAFLVPKAAGKAIAAKPLAKNVIEGVEAIEEGRKLMSDSNVVGRAVNKLFDTSKYELGLNEDFVQGWVNVARKFDGRDKASKAIMNRVIADGVEHSKNIASMAEEVRLGRLTEEEYVGLASRSMRKIAGDPIAFEEAIRHPDGFIPGAINAAERQRVRAFTDELQARAAVNTTEQALEMASKALNKTSKAEGVVAKVFANELPSTHDILFGGKGYVPEVENVHEVLYGGHAPTAGTAKVIDSIAADKGIPPSKAYTQTAKIMNTYETDPVARTVLDTVTAPTDITGAMPPSSGATIAPVAKTLSPKWQGVKAKLLAMRDAKKLEQLKAQHPELYKEVIEEEKYKAAEAALQERLGAKQAEAIEAKLDADYGSSSEGRTTVKSVAKEIPDVKSVATEAEAAEKPVDVGLRGKTKTVTAEQTARLNAQKAAEEETFKLASQVKELEPDDATKMIAEIAKSHASGKMTAEEALHKTNTIIDTMTDPENMKFTQEVAMFDWAAPFDGFVSQLRQKVGTKAFMAAFGVPAGMVAFFANPSGETSQAEAGGMGEALVRGLAAVKDVGKASAELMKNMKAANYIVDTAIPADKFLLHYSEYQRGLRGTPEGGPAAIINRFQDWAAKGGKTSLRYKLMSPGMVFDEVLGIGKQLMNNPAVFKASYQAAEYNNILRASSVIQNILRDSGIQSARKEVREMFKPLVKDMEKQVEFEWRAKKIEDLTKELEKYESGKPKGMRSDEFAASKEAAERDLAMHQQNLELLKDAIPEYHKKWNAIAEKAAQEHSSVRTFLALGDNPQFEKYPFLKNINFTPDEKVAIGRMREQLLQYKQRLKDIGEETISDNYAPHIFHPDFDARRFVNTVGGDNREAAAYMRIFRRSFNSRPLMPDLETTMNRYVADVERRIQQETFWKKEGWERVMEKTQDIPTIYNAFKQLQRGVAPVEGTLSNKIAQRIVEFEAVKRLFLSPSATLKHLIKVTGDLASRPISEATEAAPANIKMVGIRLAEANPAIRPALEKLGLTSKTDQDRLIQNYFTSIVPAHGTRRMMLDAGLDSMDEIFTKAKGVWGKIQDVGGAGINFAELADRGLTVTLGRQIAAKQGMTIEQALYGTYDMLLKNNFLSREFNPAWLNNPKIKLMAMFQGTPFKIFERRLVNFLRSGNVVKDLGEGIYNATKADFKAGNFNNTRMILKDLRDLRSTVKAGEHQLSANLFLNAALQEADFFGSTTVSTFAKDLLISGAATYGAGQVGMNLAHHFFHIPFLKPGSVEPTLNLNPGLSAISRGMDAWQQREEGDDEYLTTKIFQKWLGSGWGALLPDPLQKLIRISNNDIPKIYQDSKYKYLFAIPAKVNK